MPTAHLAMRLVSAATAAHTSAKAQTHTATMTNLWGAEIQREQGLCFAVVPLILLVHSLDTLLKQSFPSMLSATIALTANGPRAYTSAQSTDGWAVA
jgi:hypothetical protein